MKESSRKKKYAPSPDDQLVDRFGHGQDTELKRKSPKSNDAEEEEEEERNEERKKVSPPLR